LQFRISGKIVKLAVVLPAPLHPAIIYKFGIEPVNSSFGYYQGYFFDEIRSSFSLQLTHPFIIYQGFKYFS
jgi:hypothetical protein